MALLSRAITQDGTCCFSILFHSKNNQDQTADGTELGYRLLSCKMALAGKNNHSDWGKRLFLKEEKSDVDILVETGRSICRYPCHRVILSSASEVFATILNSNRSERETRRVPINDVSPDVMLILLTYIYRQSVDFDYWMIAVDVLRAADKFQIESLINHCEIYLSENLTLRNVCYILDIAISYKLSDLKTKCKEICQHGGFFILKSRPFQHLSTDAVKEILSGKSLVVETEIDVFKALWEWATTECCKKEKKLTEQNIFDEFKEFSEYVKYESMTDEELDSLPETALKNACEKNRKMLTNKKKVVEKKSIFAHRTIDFSEGLKSYLIPKFFTFGDQSSATSLGKGPFSRDASQVISLLRFSVDTNVYLAGFVLRPLFDYEDKSYFKSLRLVCKDEILHDWPEMGKQIPKLNNNDSCFMRYSSTPQDLVIQLYRFVILKAGVEYTMEVEQSPLQWPSISLIDTERYIQDDVKLFVHSKSSFGVGQMTFLRSN